MKLIGCIILVMSLFLGGCSDEPLHDRGNKSVNSMSGAKYNIVCIDGVEYLKRKESYSGYMAPHFKMDGSLYICGQ